MACFRTTTRLCPASWPSKWQPGCPGRGPLLTSASGITALLCSALSPASVAKSTARSGCCQANACRFGTTVLYSPSLTPFPNTRSCLTETGRLALAVSVESKRRPIQLVLDTEPHNQGARSDTDAGTLPRLAQGVAGSVGSEWPPTCLPSATPASSTYTDPWSAPHVNERLCTAAVRAPDG